MHPNHADWNGDPITAVDIELYHGIMVVVVVAGVVVKPGTTPVRPSISMSIRKFITRFVKGTRE